MEQSKEFDFGGGLDKLSSTSQSSESVRVKNDGKQGGCHGVEDWGESTDINSHHSDYKLLDDLRYDMLSPPLQSCLEEIAKLAEVHTSIQDGVQPNKEMQDSFTLTSLELLNSYGKRLKRLSSQRIIEPTPDATASAKVVVSRGLSSEEIMKIAGERFIKSTETYDVTAMFNKPFDLSYAGLSVEEAKKVELAELLLLSADNVSNQQFDLANMLLDQCDILSSMNGNAVQRIVYYFSKALRERINRETGRITLQDLERLESFSIDEATMAPTPTVLACHLEVPFFQAAHFAAIQTIVENVSHAKRIHVIDLGIRIGVHLTGFMQALVSQSECPLRLLKITAIGNTKKNLIEETGKRLGSFAKSISLPFSFKIIMVSDMLELKLDLFELDSDETVVIYSGYLLRSLISLADRLDSVMKVIRNLNPHIMVVTEPEVNTAAPSFVNRFVESLFYFSAYFDCLEACMGDDPNRIVSESSHFGEGIKIIVATEGEERKIRNAKLYVWRAFFARFGMVEIELSTSSLCQANLVAKKFACGNYCTLDMDGKSLLIGWKGTPMHSLSAWKFISQE